MLMLLLFLQVMTMLLNNFVITLAAQFSLKDLGDLSYFQAQFSSEIR